MKIEKINENQIRCTLTKEDLDSHQIRISELAYGTDKAKKLFRELMEQAALEYGFEADNIPLMIEAIPLSAESIILIVTKVEDPEELDTRFSKFAPFKNRETTEPLHFDGADDILDLFKNLCKEKLKEIQTEIEEDEDLIHDDEDNDPEIDDADIQIIRLFEFKTLDDLIEASHALNGTFRGDSLLFKADGIYKLVLRKCLSKPEEFNKVCNILSEYGTGSPYSDAAQACLQEHGKLLVRNAIQVLAQL